MTSPVRSRPRRKLAFLSAGLLVAAWPGFAQEETQRDLPRKRHEWNADFRRDESGKVLSANRQRALKEASRVPVDVSMRSPGTGLRTLEAPAASWQSLGPQPIQSKTGSDRNWGTVSGRIDALAVHPSNPSILLIGAATGGIWKSSDAGATWKPVSDNAPSQATSSISWSASNPSIVFASTGEVDEAHLEGTASRSLGTYLGAGLLKSTDGGETWSRVDTNLPDNAIVSRVVVDSTNPQNVVVGLYQYLDIAGDGRFLGGIYRSTNGGATFTRVYGHQVTDLAQDPNDPTRLYMAASNNDCTICPAGGVYVSTNSGQTWSSVLTPVTTAGNVRIGVSRTSPAALYASVVDDAHSHAGTGAGIYYSSDAGATWTKENVHAGMCPSDNNQCDYDHFIVPHPSNPSVVYFGSVDLYKSVDGAQTWNKITIQYTDGRPEPVHPDQHAALILPGSPNTVLFGNDGGLYKTTDAGATFQNLNATLSLTQVQRMDLHPTNASVLLGATQDNGNVRYAGSMLWNDVTSGDGGFDAFRRDNPAQVAAGHYYAFITYSGDGGVTFNSATPCGTLMDCDKGSPLETMSFYPPAVAAQTGPVLLLGTNRIWANNTLGSDPNAWVARSADKITNSRFTTIAAVGNGNGVVWGGTVTGSVFFSSDGGATFSPRFTGLPAAIVTSIVPFTADGRGAYVTFGGFLGAPSRHVFYTTDAGATWTNLSSNLPDVPVLSMAFNPANPDDLFVGTDAGVFRNPAGSSDWFSFNQGLPAAAPVYALAFSASGELHAGTYGRGVYKINLGGGTGPCVAAAGTLCLNGGRFKVEVTWRVPAQGTSGSGVAVPLTGDTGYFWFFSSNNIELVVKVVDGRPVNNRFWVFYGALSNVEFTITVTDTVTGTVKTYFNPSGQLASVADTSAFPGLRTPEPPALSSSAGGDGTLPLRPLSGAAAGAGTRIERTDSTLAAPNLTPFKPSTWSDKIVVSRTPGIYIDSSSLTPSDSLYVSFAVANLGDAATAVRFFVDLYVDGVFLQRFFADPPVNPNFFVGVQDYFIGSLSSGSHTVRISADPTGVIAESNENDNDYTKTIQVGASALPNLFPVMPTGWSDKIVVTRTPGSRIDGTSLTTSDSLYVSWAVGNGGAGPTASRFFSDLYLDGSLKNSWFTDPPLNAGFYTHADDYPLGTLSAGTHTLRLVADSQGSIAESNELDNEYTKTFNVSAPAPVCVPNGTTLCLNAGRFRVQVTWRVPAQGTSGNGNAVSLTGDTGYMWFFTANNIELVIKVVDGRAVNGKFWVFFGALSNVEFTITITDTLTGAVRTYFNPSGQLASVADTAAF
ncbi:MAG TPA: CARDB domain-containing protein [Thermoanaerobaculia bacterium]|nr:CARDB domain-containing protein [Thermoanaerobaculia bacterium]